MRDTTKRDGAATLPRDRGTSSLRKHHVAEQIRKAVVGLRLLPGHRLVERDLCEQFHVSRQLVREALNELSAEGLVEAIPHKGFLVTLVTLEQARGIYEIRAELEALASRAFALRASSAERHALQTALRDLEQSFVDAESLAWLPAKERYYSVLFSGTKNEILPALMRQLQGRITILRAMTLATPGRNKQSTNELRRVLKAIDRRDGEAAANASRVHVANACAIALEALRVEALAKAVAKKPARQKKAVRFAKNG